MNILVIDGMGGGIGKAIIEILKNNFKNQKIIAVGTNATATATMLKSGADFGATGENALIYNCKNADIIIGAIGIISINSMYGEISEKIVMAISSSDAKKILIPVSKCNIKILGVIEKSLQNHLNEIIIEIKNYIVEHDKQV